MALFPEDIDAAIESMMKGDHRARSKWGDTNIGDPVLPDKASPQEKHRFTILLRERKTLADAAKPFIEQTREALQRDLDRLKKSGTTPTNEEVQTMWKELRRSVGRGPVRDLDAKNDEIVEFIKETRRNVFRSTRSKPKSLSEQLAEVRRQKEMAAQSTNPRDRATFMHDAEERERMLLASGAAEEDELNRRIASRGEELRGLMGGRKKRKTRKTRKSRKVTRRRR
jgi:hypothetical protein